MHSKHTLIFATNNQHKIAEIQSLLDNNFDIITLSEAGIYIDIPEPHDSLEKNALEKAHTIFKTTNQNCFGEDTGLEIEVLNSEPGVRSARYAGEEKSDEKNIEKVLKNLENSTNRAACFRTIIALIWNNQPHLFEGVCKGKILTKPIGKNGFGYDSIFMPDGSPCSFAQMSLTEKNIYSHRRKAVDKLTMFLKNTINESNTT